MSTVNSRFKKDLKLQIHLHKAFFSDDRFLDSLHKSFLNQTTLDLRKEKWTFLNWDFTVLICFDVVNIEATQKRSVGQKSKCQVCLTTMLTKNSTVNSWFKKVHFSFLKSRVVWFKKDLCSESKNRSSKNNAYVGEFATWDLS